MRRSCNSCPTLKIFKETSHSLLTSPRNKDVDLHCLFLHLSLCLLPATDKKMLNMINKATETRTGLPSHTGKPAGAVKDPQVGKPL